MDASVLLDQTLHDGITAGAVTEAKAVDDESIRASEDLDVVHLAAMIDNVAMGLAGNAHDFYFERQGAIEGDVRGVDGTAQHEHNSSEAARRWEILVRYFSGVLEDSTALDQANALELWAARGRFDRKRAEDKVTKMSVEQII